MGEVGENKTPEPGRTPEPDDGEAVEGSGRVQVSFSEDEENFDREEEMLGDRTPEPRRTPEHDKESDEKASRKTDCRFSDDKDDEKTNDKEEL